MSWTPRLTQLNDTLSDLVISATSISRFVTAAGLKPAAINFNGNALDIWNSVIEEARKNDKIVSLIKAVLEKYPENPYLKSALDRDEIDYSLAPEFDKVSNWKAVDKDTLEVLTMGMSTLLPISFLEKGIQLSKAVAKVEINNGTSLKVGTGFRFKLEGVDDVFFMTNNHVINQKKDIGNTRIIFNFETDIMGIPKIPKIFKIDNSGPWYTSPIQEYDVTICKLISNVEIDEFGFVPIKNVQVEKNDFVNIIQHPGGQLKQIALYHNIVTNSTERVVQYLTDTMKGSSGSPVFNSNWDLVALHHSGGPREISEPKITETKFRNEGIYINKIIEFLNHSILTT